MKKSLIIAAIPLLVSCGKTTRFERLAADKTGIDFVNVVEEKDSFNILHDEYMYNGGGVGVVDLNRDGLSDLIFTANKVSPRVYLNEGELRFRDITSAFQDIDNGQWYSGVSIVDINADGWPDVYMTSTSGKDPEKRKNRLWVNQGATGDLLFKEMAAVYGIADKSYTVHAGFFDYDLDGDLDLYLLNNIVNKSIPTNYRPKITDGSSVNNDKLYRNDGDGKFTDVTIEAGIVYEGYGLGLAFGDINKDGYPDIYVSNDYISNDLLYINQGDGTFRNEAGQYLSYQSRFSMGNEMVDVNNDGNLDIMSVDMMPEQYFRKKQTINGNSYLVYINNEKYGYEPQYVRNMLHLHNGFLDGKMLPFSEVGQMMGVFQTEWSWSPLFADYDNDGDRDLMMTNGFPKDLTDKDFTNYKAQVYGFVASDKHILGKIPVVKVSNYAFENAGPYSFVDRTEEWGMSIPSFSNGAAFADLDNDGDLDYVINNINDAAFIYRNNTIGKLEEKTNQVKLSLEGKAPNTMAIGAKVELWAGGKYQYYEHYLTRGYISSVDPVIHFGLGNIASVDSIKVTWPLGSSATLLKNVAANQVLTLMEKDAVTVPIYNGVVRREPHLFERLNGVIDYAHHEEDYVDFFQEQRIIQHKLSQIGPCMAKGDINGDGMSDLVIGGSKSSPAALFIYKDGKFTKAEAQGLTTSRACTESDMAIFDADRDGDNDIISVSGGYENEKESDYEHFLFRNNGGSFTKEKLPLPAFCGSVVRPADFDHDGDMDFFIGARVRRAMYPLAPPSYLLVNNNGTFETPVPLEIGMVTDAVWSDYDRDGWQDLIVAREWDSVIALKNESGKNLAPDQADPWASLHGFWSAVAAADLDNDGDDDYVLGNLGKNHRFTVNDEFRMTLYAVDIDGNSFVDPIVTSYWKDINGKMREYPVNYLDELAAQSPFFRKKFTSYTRFSYTTADSILDKSSIAPEKVFHVNTTASYVLWNDPDGFKWQELPPVIQTSPVKKIMARDFDADGTLDLIVAGNDFTYDVSTGYFDANKGIVLLGREGRTFAFQPPSSSGLLLRGQVTSLLYFDGPASFVVSGINRDSVSVFLHRPEIFKGLTAR